MTLIGGPRDLDTKEATHGFSTGRSEQTFARSIPGHDATLGIDRVQEHSRLVEDPALVGRESAGFQHEQSVRKSHRKLCRHLGHQPTFMFGPRLATIAHHEEVPDDASGRAQGGAQTDLASGEVPE
jgi:hypothetical protein